MLMKFEFNKEIIEKAKELGFKVKSHTPIDEFVVMIRGGEKISLLPNELGGFHECVARNIERRKVTFEGIKMALGMIQEVAIEEDLKIEEEVVEVGDQPLTFDRKYGIWFLNQGDYQIRLYPDGNIFVCDVHTGTLYQTSEQHIGKWLK